MLLNCIWCDSHLLTERTRTDTRAIPENGGDIAAGAACGAYNTVESGDYMITDLSREK